MSSLPIFRQPGVPEGAVHLGLRFPRHALRPLKRVRQQAMEGGLAVGPYDAAVWSAETGEPMIVVAESVTEVQVMAAMFTRLGIPTPSIEELSGREGRTPG